MVSPRSRAVELILSWVKINLSFQICLGTTEDTQRSRGKKKIKNKNPEPETEDTQRRRKKKKKKQKTKNPA